MRCFIWYLPCLGQYTDAEVRSALGRADVVVKTVITIYVFEFKLNTETGQTHTVEEAIKQIDEQGYLIPYSVDKQRLVKVGVVFSGDQRNIGEWKIV
jgi:hypothetical protein